MTAIDWGFLIASIRLPVLKRFAISFGDIPQDAIITFLSKHSHLTHFEYHHIRYTTVPKGVPRGFKGVFKYLEQLTTPEHILRFLPTMDQTPCLTSVAVIIEDGHMHFSIVVEQALRRLSSCVKKIKLKLDVGLPLDAFHAKAARVHVRPSFLGEDGIMLRCVISSADGNIRQMIWAKFLPGSNDFRSLRN